MCACVQTCAIHGEIGAVQRQGSIVGHADGVPLVIGRGAGPRHVNIHILEGEIGTPERDTKDLRLAFFRYELQLGLDGGFFLGTAVSCCCDRLRSAFDRQFFVLEIDTGGSGIFDHFNGVAVIRFADSFVNQKVAISWVENGVETISQAKEQAAAYSRNCYTVLNAFGIKNRGPASSELEYINKWADTYGFSTDIIQEACRRTISATHQPSFEYADSILTKWYECNIHHLTDINALDHEFQKERSLHRSPATKPKNVTRNLNNFERRSYDMDSLEEQLLKSN